MSHSPIPWQIDFSTTQGPVAWKILDAQGKHIGYINCPVFDSTWERGSEANQAENVSAVITAGFLVRAVNYHDRLVQALDQLTAEPHRCLVDDGDSGYFTCAHCGQADYFSPNHELDCPSEAARALLAEIKAQSPS